MHDIKRAGEIIAGEMLWSDESAPKIREAFHIANSWRDSHAYPMRSVRYSLIWYMRKRDLHGLTAARLKRMQAIRRKLRRISLNLNQLQDLGGCRAILPSIADVQTLVGELRANSRHEIWAEDDYISAPKPDGYRSHHLRFKFCGQGATKAHDGRRIEIQIRTRLQHSWATAVEAVGMFRREDLKGDRGSLEWLRLFQLMSAEFAAAERSPEGPGLPCHSDRYNEIRDLEKRLDAVSTLDNLSNAVQWTEISLNPREKPTHFLIRYNNVTRQVLVEPYYVPTYAALSYDNAEAIDNKSGRDTTNIVLVEVDKIENLKAAYPNYFGDVQLFKDQLRQITKGKSAEEYTVRPQETVAVRPKEKASLAWYRRGSTRWR